VKEQQLVAIHRAGTLLGVASSSVQRLVDCGLLGRPQRTQSSMFVEASLVEALAERTYVEPPHPSALVLRLGRPSPVDDPTLDDWPGHERRRTGWDEDDPDRQSRRDAWRGWWRIAKPSELVGELAVATVSGFVVDVALVIGVTVRDGQTVLSLADVAGVGADRFSGRRLRLSQGMGAVRFLDAVDWPPATAEASAVPEILASFGQLQVQGRSLAKAARQAGLTWDAIGESNGVSGETARSLWGEGP